VARTSGSSNFTGRHPIILWVECPFNNSSLTALIVLSRYYGPFREMSDYGPQYCDVRNPDARAKHKAVSCPDKILTAFCQLGALRLRARRCLIFFFDVNHAYIMAEATQTLSLEDDTIHEPGDEVWMGHSVIPRDVACCETTVNLPSFPISAAADSDIKKSAFVVNDLTKHPDLSTRPYVTGFPNGRFYAGVPITTPSGINIGAYCILDDKVRDGVSDKDLVFLRDMSKTVMTHLEAVRALAERQQTNRMVAGLGDFVRGGASDAGRTAPSATHTPPKEVGVEAQNTHAVEYRLPDALVDATGTPATPSSQSLTDYFVIQHQPSPLASHAEVLKKDVVSLRQSSEYGGISSSNHQKHGLPDRLVRTDSGSVPSFTASPMENSTVRPLPRPRENADDPKSTYQRAAETLCQSLNIDGVAFLDASVRVFGGLSNDQNAESFEGSTAESGDSTGNFSHSESAAEPRVKRARVCQVLGCAQTVRDDMLEMKHPKNLPPKKLTEVFLRKLMNRHPHGKVWTFDEDLKTHSEDGFSSDESGAGIDAAAALSPSVQQRKATRRDRKSDGETLQAAFPGARCIALSGIWDYTRKRWAVAGLYWTLDPFRTIAKETEMKFVAAFCDIIVAETKRLEVVGTDKAKSDFISSISHELRSPLHGILGSCELLSDRGLDDTAMTFLEQIDSCGRTLLEIIEHLLDFANIKSQRLRKGSVKSSKISRKFLSSTGSSSTDDLEALQKSVALDALTEDTIISSIYSFYYGQRVHKHTNPSVILDIDRSDGKAWTCSLATGGWKRICINLVTNALKYTPSGFIRVSLKQEPKPGSRRRFNALLTVSDTGIGMSKQFQSDRLFHDFAQEDTLSDGLGLGLHMVSRIVYAMGGKIEVVSNGKGTGTCVTVLVPLEHSQNSSHRSDSWDKEIVTSPNVFGVLKVGLVTGTDVSTDLENSSTTALSSLAIASVENNLKFMGVQSERCKWQSVSSYDLIIVMEAELAGCLATLRNSNAADDRYAKNADGLPPVLVICNHNPSARILRDLWTTDDLRSYVTMEHVALPCGIKQISQAISSALRQHEKRKMAGLDMVEVYQESRRESLADGVALRDIGTNSQPQLRSFAPVWATTDITFVEQAWTDSTWSTYKSAHVLPVQSSPAEAQLSSSSNRRISAPQADLDSQSARILGPGTPSTEVTSALGLPTQIPILLLVDDNNINLKLLSTFAKKYKYSHILAENGQLALDAFENAHRNLSSCNSNEAQNVGTVRTGMPNTIIMDINMPVMDGYEAVQRIRIYEKKHRLTASKIIAVTALQSEAARTEAIGSGFDMFLSKPLKLKDLAKLIEVC
jgi:signal transduction histidine kinase/CheY-like chemotaxis protein